MKIEKINKTSYRIRKTYKGKAYSVILPYKPTQKEAIEIMAKKLNMNTSSNSHLTFFQAYTAYLELKSNILSPSTKRGYSSLINVIPEWFKQKYISDINSLDVQKLVNDYSKNHAPKTVKNYYSFITAITTTYNTDLVIKCDLPQAQKNNTYIPTISDIKALFEAIKGTKYEVLFKLAAMGMRRSEICALTMDDINGNKITINKALVEDENKKWVIKVPKTTESERTIIIPDDLAELIQNQGLWKGVPSSIDKILKRYLKRLDIPPFGIHKLRHFYVSYAHSLGVPDKYIQSVTGHKTNKILDEIYKHALSDQTESITQEVANNMQNLY